MVTDINHKIKIAQIITRMDWGGSPDIVRIICQNLDKNKFEVTLICGQNSRLSEKSRKFLEDFKGNLIIIPSLRRNINPFFDFWAFIRLYAILREKKFDIVHTHTAKAGILGRIAAKFAGGCKIIHTSHGHNFYGYFSRFFSNLLVLLERVVAGFTNKIVALTELEKKDLIEFKVAEEEKISVLHIAVELNAYKKLNIQERENKRNAFVVKKEELLVGMVCRLEPIKGPQYFIEAAQLIANKHKHVKFIFVGDGSLRRELENKISNAGLKERFIFTGWRNDALEMISLLDIMVLSSLNEAVGLVLIEAQGLGVPVVATKVGGIPETVEDNKTGILVRPQDIQALSLAIEELIKNKEKRELMGRQGENRIKYKYSVEDFMNRLDLIYEKIIREA